jgi:glycosyltransferase involved in cell wall biosynthesis
LIKDRFKGKIVLAPRGMLHKGGLQKKTFKKSIFLTLFRMVGWHKKILFHATDDQEREDIKKFFSGALAIEVAGNIPHYNERPWKERPKVQRELNCVYISRIHPKKNLAYFLEVLKNANNGLSVYFDVYGEEDDKDYATKCKQASGSLRKGIQTRFLGPLSHDKIIQTLEQYHLFVLPTLGENFAHAVYEALSAGCPVLISDQTPWHNLAQQRVGFDYPLQESMKFKEAVEQMASLGQQEYNMWSKNAYQKAAEYYKQSDLVNTYLKLFS